ncbi:His/Gly/Thr/Pro-type tRNA ligase C-terminal domain-containing protein [Rhodococcus tukisamuensis]|uniref:Threonyl-tRNA synthetase n=1 Tax=Rhodococcus tukisamuensis TaxID=168276 RepID=A0A1G6WE78_9NOCA|nr:His/Gly/Thr/Pro-type tRNA ligase C-terminal domain-containing protein [Rhodococcus tukisamuensis]SDD63376.1 threonyl-tRNA synthetase [Rhodococcus tukisamuensis]
MQLDFNQPDRFRLEYTGEDGARHRPVMIHRGLLGSMERMVALLVERFEGRMPPWLAPRQVVVLPVSERHRDEADKLRVELRENEIRAEVLGAGSLGARIRESRRRRDPYTAVVGDAELENRTVSAVVPASGQRGSVDREVFVRCVLFDVRTRALRPGELG